MAKLTELSNALFEDFYRSMNRQEAERARREPKANRLTTIFEKPLSYRYYEGKSSRGIKKTRYCYSVHRNVAGYFLIWRESLKDKMWTRDQWDSTKDKRDAIATCRERAKG